MASTYSSLKIELIGTGEQDGTWGDTTNINLGTAIEQAITGSGDVTFTSADVTLTLANSNSAQVARNLRLVLVGTSGGARQLIVPSIEKQYIIKNELADAVTVKNSSGTGIAVPSGTTMMLFNDATNVVDVTTFVTSLNTSGNVTVGGTLSAVSPVFTGTPTAPTAANGTSTTQIATTSFVNSSVTTITSSLGTLSTQNANAVAITGGTIAGASGSNPSMSVGTATTATTATDSTQFQGKTKLGLGITSEVWNNVTGSRANNTTYTNSNTYPIMFAVTGTKSGAVNTQGGLQMIVGGVVITNTRSRTGNNIDYTATLSSVAIVPPGVTYSISLTSDTSLTSWLELS